MPLGGVIGRRRGRRADRPARLVSENDRRNPLRRLVAKRQRHLFIENVVGDGPTLVFGRLAQAEDRRQTRRHCGVELSSNQVVGLAEMLEAFGMRELDVTTAGFDQHRRGDLASPSSRRLPVHVLCADADGERREGLLCGGQRSEWRKNEHLDRVAESGDERRQLRRVTSRLGRADVHFPARSGDEPTHSS